MIAAARRRGDCRCSPARNCRLRRQGEPPSGGGENAVPTAEEIAAFGGRESRRLAAETKGDRTPSMVSCPLLTPLTFLCAATPFGRAAKRGLRGLGSVRRADFGTLLCPEFPLRSSPRITVRGQTVQGGGGTLRKAPLLSSVDPWSTKRHCGPLAFRRATEGSRVQRRVWGSQEGAREPYGALAPFCPSPWARRTPPVNTGTSAARRRQCPACPSAANLACGGRPPERRNRSPSAAGKGHGA